MRVIDGCTKPAEKPHDIDHRSYHQAYLGESTKLSRWPSSKTIDITNMCNDQYYCRYGFNDLGNLYFIVMNAQNLLSLAELTTEVSRLLDQYGLSNAQHDQRVSAVPDVRTIRYYTTLGLLDRPIIEPPRQAKYKMRHVWQLLAIKALQGAQLSLAEVQNRLYGLTEEELKAIVAAVRDSVAHSKQDSDGAQPILWQEFVVSPGVKIMIADGWTCDPGMERQMIEEKLRAIMQRVASGKRANGGTT